MVREFTPEQRCRFLQFVTGTSRVPATGFKDLWGALTAARGRRQQRSPLLIGVADAKADGRWACTGSDGPRRFCIEVWGTPQSLPRSHTWYAPWLSKRSPTRLPLIFISACFDHCLCAIPCSFNRIDLPPYQAYEVMVAKVTMAMEQTAGFGVE